MDITKYLLLNALLVLSNALLVRDHLLTARHAFMDQWDLMVLALLHVAKTNSASEVSVLLVIRVVMDAATCLSTV